VPTSWKNEFFAECSFCGNFSFMAFKLVANRKKKLFAFFGFLPHA